MIFEFITRHLALMYELAGLFAGLGIVIFVGAVLLARLEDVSLEDAIYFAMVTALTVGFGDIAPRTRGGRVVTILLAFLGVVVLGIFVAIAGQALEQAVASP